MRVKFDKQGVGRILEGLRDGKDKYQNLLHEKKLNIKRSGRARRVS